MGINQGRLARLPDAIATLPGVIAVAVLYGLIHGTLRYAASPTLGVDDVIATVMAQDWAFGYTPRNPPLYDWLLKTAQTLMGVNLVATLVLKYALLTMAAVFTYLASLRVIGDRHWATLTAFSLALCYQIGWNAHEGVTHTAVLTAVVMATLWSLLRLIDCGRRRDYLVFGVCTGLGLLSKYNFLSMLFVLLVASAFTPTARQRVFAPRILISVAVAALIVAPHIAWLVHNGPDAFVSKGLAGFSVGTLGRRLFWALVAMVKSPLDFLIPFVVILPLLFPGMIERLALAFRSFGARGLSSDHQRLLFLMTLVSFAVVFVTALLLGRHSGNARYLHPLFLSSVLLLMAVARDVARTPLQTRRYVQALLAGCIAVLGVRTTQLYMGYCGHCHPLERFEPLAAGLRDAVSTSGVLTDDPFIAGNLRRLVPGLIIAQVGKPTYIPLTWAAAARDKVTVVVRAGRDEDARARALLESVDGPAKAEAPSEFRSVHVASYWKGHLARKYQRSDWTILEPVAH